MAAQSGIGHAFVTKRWQQSHLACRITDLRGSASMRIYNFVVRTVDWPVANYRSLPGIFHD